jgi:hypothetical protein
MVKSKKMLQALKMDAPHLNDIDSQVKSGVSENKKNIIDNQIKRD